MVIVLGMVPLIMMLWLCRLTLGSGWKLAIDD